MKIVVADKSVMGKCKVVSLGAPLSEVLRHSLSPYFIIDYEESGGTR